MECRWVVVPHEAPVDAEDARRMQEELRGRLVLPGPELAPPGTVTGLDISYEVGSDRAIAAAVVMDARTGAVVEVAVAEGTVSFPYVPGLLAFREIPLLLDAIGKLGRRPEVLVCDGFGIAHPRRFGLACHLGVLLDVPAFGVAKNEFVGAWTEPGVARGEWSPVLDGDELLGRALRTRTGVKPVFVSAGHRISLAAASDLAVALSTHFRVPEPTRQADIISRQALRGEYPVGP